MLRGYQPDWEITVVEKLYFKKSNYLFIKIKISKIDMKQRGKKINEYHYYSINMNDDRPFYWLNSLKRETRSIEELFTLKHKISDKEFFDAFSFLAQPYKLTKNRYELHKELEAENEVPNNR
ncbi:MAG: hypothetical protein LBE13_07330 [Bacteroidales bacterium]|jgi:hypothetical protein|nr:hypothetical protein [Bacteroidales bacterium]